jgi:23S rRNA (cytidine2498-2'-O)-methyltransferase
VRSRAGDAFVEYVLAKVADSARIAPRLRFDQFVFARQLVFVAAWIEALPTGDRVAALLPAVSAVGVRFGALRLETADTNEARALAPFLRAFERPFLSQLDNAALLDDADPALPRLHLFFRGSARVALGATFPGNSSPWPMGIPRLALPRGAPSRSALKLVEALHVWLDSAAMRELLHEGSAAVDLGAAPGGWTSVLVARGVHVTAVDNGAIDARLLETGLVEHARADGFRYRPRAPVAWLVCDIVEQPKRVAALVGDWLANRWCERAIFNLKLPMKKRFQSLDECAAIVHAHCAASGVAVTLAFRHLYHDREEVTGYAVRVAKGSPPGGRRGQRGRGAPKRKAAVPRDDPSHIVPSRRRP